MVRSGATRKQSPESTASGQSRNNELRKATRSRRGKERYEDSSVADSVDVAEDSQNGVDSEISTRRKRSPAATKSRSKEDTPEPSDDEEISEDDEDAEDDTDDDEGEDEEKESDDSDDESESIDEESKPVPKKSRAKKRQVDLLLESSDGILPMSENGKRRRQARKTEPQSPGRASPRSPGAIGGSPGKRGRPRRSFPIVSLDDATKRRMAELIVALKTFSEKGRSLIEVFYGLPPKVHYPDYYEVISEPIDMYTIEDRIEENKYRSDRALMYDLALMLKNAKYYNEEDSEIYRDASILDKHLKASWEKIVAEKGEKTDQLYIMFESVFNFEDEAGRQLIVPFMKLPSRAEFPAYYEVIRRPIDVARIREKLFSDTYSLLDDLVSDFRLLFDNSCKFNEPDSQLYRDALVLLRLCTTKRQELLGISTPAAFGGNDQIRMIQQQHPQMPGGAIPGVPMGQQPVEPPPEALRVLHDMMRELLATIHQCRCPTTDDNSEPEFYVKRLSDIVPPTDQNSSTTTGLSQLPPLAALERVRQNIELGRYRRLDRFQDDVFEILHNVRTLSPPSSISFQASVHLQEQVIKHRDTLTELGRRLHTPASQYGLIELQADVERDIGATTTPMPNDGGYHSDEGEEETQDDQTNAVSAPSGLSSITLSGQTFSINDYVYVKTFAPTAADRADGQASSRRIVQIKKIWEDEDTKQSMIGGDIFMRPEETFHMVNRKFYANEVFKSDSKHSGPAAAIAGRCLVLLPRTFFRFKVEGLPEDDVVICDTRYMTKARHMAKLRGWKGVIIPGETVVSNGAEECANNATGAAEQPTAEQSKDEQNNKDEQKEVVGGGCFLVSGNIRLVRRQTPLKLARTVPSVFAVKQHEQAAASDAASTANPTQAAVAILDKFRENVPLVDGNANGDSNIELFEQFIGPPPARMALKLGDFVYISPAPYQTLVLRVERLFTQSTPEGTGAFVGGTRLFIPAEVIPGHNDPMSRELILGSQIETHPIGRVVGRCAVFACREYCILRCPEVLERDTFLCESECITPEAVGMPIKLRKIQSVAVPNFKKYSPNVTEDEVYFLPKPMTIRKAMPVAAPLNHIPLSSSSSSATFNQQLAGESSLGGADELAKMAALSGHDEFKVANSPSSSITHSEAPMPSSTSRKLSTGSHRGRGGKSSNRGNGPISGWTVFCRRMHQDTEMSRLMQGKEFPERAKMIAERWRTMTTDQRAKYIEEARIEEEGRRARRAAMAAAAAAAEGASMSSVDASKSPAPSSMMHHQQTPMQQQPPGQMVMTPNGPMMIAPPQMHVPDQMQHGQMPPGMQPYAPGGFYQRPAMQQQFPGQQQMIQGHYGPQLPPGGHHPPQQQHGFPPGQMPYVNGHHPGQPMMQQQQQQPGFPAQHPQHPQQQQHFVQHHQGAPNYPPQQHLNRQMYPPPPHQQQTGPHGPPPHQQQLGPHGPPPQGMPPQQAQIPFSPPQQKLPMPQPQMMPHQQLPPQQQQHPPPQPPPPMPPQQQQPQPQQMPPHPLPMQQPPRPQEPSHTAIQPGQQPGPIEMQQRPLLPVVHAVPPRPQRLVHSEAFLRYLDGLGGNAAQANSRPFITDWPRAINVTETNIDEALKNSNTRARLSSMVGPELVEAATNGVVGEESRTTLVNALYKLNSSLISDSLNLSRVLDYEQL